MIKKAVIYTIAIVSLLCQQVSANQTNVSSVKDSIVKHSLEIGVDPALALSIAKSESGFRHEARSSHGAVGVFQLMPSTARKLGVNPYYLSDNIRGGLIYYKKLYNMFGSTELALAAYNAGPGAVKKYKSVPPIRETKRFVSKIMTEYNHQKSYPDAAIVKRKTTHLAAHYAPIKAVAKKQEIILPKEEIITLDVNKAMADLNPIPTIIVHPVVAAKKSPSKTIKAEQHKYNNKSNTMAKHTIKIQKTVAKKPPVPTKMIPAQGII